jgi:hypothetical protein
LYNKYYKDDLEMNDKRGKNVKQQQCIKHTKQLEEDSPITNKLTAQEKKEWADVFKKADEGDKASNKDVENVTCVKEMMQLMYVPAVWVNGDEPNEEDKEEEDKEDKDNKEKTANKKPQLLFEAHFMGVTYSPATKATKDVGPLSPKWVLRASMSIWSCSVPITCGQWLWGTIVQKRASTRVQCFGGIRDPSLLPAI